MLPETLLAAEWRERLGEVEVEEDAVGARDGGSPPALRIDMAEALVAVDPRRAPAPGDTRSDAGGGAVGEGLRPGAAAGVGLSDVLAPAGGPPRSTGVDGVDEEGRDGEAVGVVFKETDGRFVIVPVVGLAGGPMDPGRWAGRTLDGRVVVPGVVLPDTEEGVADRLPICFVGDAGDCFPIPSA